MRSLTCPVKKWINSSRPREMDTVCTSNSSTLQKHKLKTQEQFTASLVCLVMLEVSLLLWQSLLHCFFFHTPRCNLELKPFLNCILPNLQMTKIKLFKLNSQRSIRLRTTSACAAAERLRSNSQIEPMTCSTMKWTP